jgi:hypothetical protein
MVVFCYYFFHEEAKSMGRWNEYQQPTRKIEQLRKELTMTTASSEA